MEQVSSKDCPACKSTGIVCHTSDSPILEDRRFCPNCRAGWALFEKVSEIISRNRVIARARVA